MTTPEVVPDHLTASRSSGASGPIAWTVLGIVLVSAVAAGVLYRRVESLPVLRAELPSFALTDQAGEPFGSEHLRGRIWVADFFYTRCSLQCPMMVSRMIRVQDAIQADPELAAHASIVSFSLDAAHDTPDVLAAYGKRNGADRALWRLLTGDAAAIRGLCQDGFGLSAGDASQGRLHSDRFALIDARGRIRAYYRPTAEPGDFVRLIGDLRTLVAGL